MFRTHTATPHRMCRLWFACCQVNPAMRGLLTRFCAKDHAHLALQIFEGLVAGRGLNVSVNIVDVHCRELLFGSKAYGCFVVGRLSTKIRQQTEDIGDDHGAPAAVPTRLEISVVLAWWSVTCYPQETHCGLRK